MSEVNEVLATSRVVTRSASLLLNAMQKDVKTRLIRTIFARWSTVADGVIDVWYALLLPENRREA